MLAERHRRHNALRKFLFGQKSRAQSIAFTKRQLLEIDHVEDRFRRQSKLGKDLDKIGRWNDDLVVFFSSGMLVLGQRCR